MRTSVAGSSTERRRGAGQGLRTSCARGARGFTLFELLAVLAIVGIVLSAVSLSLRGDRRAELLQDEAERLQALTRLAQEQAVLRGETLGVRFGPDGYAFLVRGSQGWRTLTADSVLRPRRVPFEVLLQLSVEGVAVSDLESRAPDGALPDVVLWTSGEVTPFRLVLGVRDGVTAWSLTGSAQGTLRLTRADGHG
ncbi:MAG: type II secretion system minor pseudopilin GspH [Gammaproteobacteria bacterium]|jgi:general secretion pathway protein H|nr:type II secretion system minor pseudopilin GspH [Gammaproteobacteria bacterium]